MGIDDLQTMPGIQCVDCHMHVGDADGTNAAMFGGHLWSTFIQEEGGSESSSCSSISCHPSLDADAAHLIVQGWQTEYADLVSTATQKVDDAVSAGNIDPTKLEEAQFNLAFAEGDESG
ncbi:MAG: hypothetical protein GWP19_16310, partial [Planctomycetia bacterium]|nr:hypothetical protein [Planctomycetia bacterium]